MKSRILIEVVLLSMLAVYGSLLLRRNTEIARRTDAKVDANRRLLFVGAAALDLFGNRVEASTPPREGRSVAFLLRGATAAEDLAWWRRVAELLPSEAGVRLVGYCNNSACIDILRKQPEPIGFPVVVYGALIDAQALMNADEEGKFIQMGRGIGPTSIQWRGKDLRPEGVIRRVID